MSSENNVFTDEGRLMQTEYAVKRVSQAGTIMGLVCTDGVILFGLNNAKTTQKEKIYKLNSSTYCAVSGLFGDINTLIQKVRRTNITNKMDMLEDTTTRHVAKCVSFHKNENTRYYSARPYAVGFLYAGFDDEYLLYSTDPSGTINRWKAFAIGSDETSINQALKTNYKENLNMERGFVYLLDAFKKAREVNFEMAEKMEVLFYTKEGVKFLQAEEIKNVLTEMGVKI